MCQIGATLLLALSILPYLRLPNVTAWKLSLVATEFGHWIALVALGWVIFYSLSQKKSLSKVMTVAALSVSAVISLIPSIEAKMILRDEFSVSRLFFGISDSQIRPQTFVFEELPAKLTLDFYPAKKSARGNPWLLVIHGGGWNSGEKEDLPELNSYLANRGISVAAISYRLAPHAIWPAPREDAAAAVRFVKSHSQELGTDPTRWAILGRSAGGQIAEDLAYSIQDPSLKGCVALYAPADMVFAYEFGKEDDILRSPSLIREYLGGSLSEREDVYRDASPIYWVRSNSVPTLLLHGENDTLVWHRQSERLEDRLRSVAVSVTFISLPWATHGFDYNFNGPGGQIMSTSVEHFLERIFL
jgi:acetyl esterase/lipase